MLYEHLHRPLLGYLRGKGARDPEDVLGEVFLRLARSISRFSGDLDQFRGYAFTIALNCVRDAARRRGARPDMVFVAPDHLPGTGGPSASAEDEALGGMALDSYREGFAELTPEQQQVLYLRIVADLSIDETAEMIGKSAGSVKQLQRRALERLRVLLSDPATTGGGA
ncbi:MAG: sigma-70 family RNA polymerase sigma factor [Acidimicrobiia bacterium]|nr:sigma-70 family RNA polymerase sigma factor [Acidimicrobiia bacterium]